MMDSLKKVLTPALLALGLCSAPASATIIFSTDSSAVLPGSEINILFGSAQTGTTITGEVDHTGIGAIFTSLTGETLKQNAQGQADVFNALNTNGGNVNCATDLALCLTSMDFHLANLLGFGDFMVNLVSGVGEATVIANDNQGNTYTFTLGNGQNFFSLLAIDGQLITDVKVFAPGGFNDYKQPRVSEIQGLTLPEPGALLLLGTVLGAIGVTSRKRSV
jgi:hypothetical protein